MRRVLRVAHAEGGRVRWVLGALAVVAAAFLLVTVAWADAAHVRLSVVFAPVGNDVSVTGVVGPGTAAGGVPRADWTVVVQERERNHWVQRVTGALAAKGDASKFALSWIAHPVSSSRVVSLRVILRARAHVIAASSARSVEIRPPLTVNAVLKAGTVEPAVSQVLEVKDAGSPTQRVALAAGARVPTVGSGIVVPVSANAPEGLFGVVTAVQPQNDGSTVVLSRPAALSQIYKTLQIQATGTFADASVTAGAFRARARAAGVGPLSPSLSCSGAAPTPNVSVDLSSLRYIFSLDVPYSVDFLVDGAPSFSLNADFPGQVSCSGQLTASIPIGTTGLFVEIGPQISLTAGGDVGAHFTWAPSLAFGFFRSDTGSGNFDIHDFTNHGTITFTGTAGISASLALRLALTAGGQAGVEGTIGPTLSATVTPSATAGQTCRSIDGSAGANVDAFAHVWFADWTFQLAQITFTHCRPLAAGSRRPQVRALHSSHRDDRGRGHTRSAQRGTLM